MGVVTERSAGGAAESTKVRRLAARGAESRASGARVEARVKPGSLGGLGQSVRARQCSERWYELVVGSSRVGPYKLYTTHYGTRSKRGNMSVCKYNSKFIAKNALKTLDYKQQPRIL